LEGWAYALLSYQIDIPERLGLAATSGLYSFARYFLAVFGAGLTLLLASLGYLLGKEVERLQSGSEARRRNRLARRQGWAAATAAQQIERTERALERLQATVAGFQLNLVQQFRREVDPAGSSDELVDAIRDAMAAVLESPRRVGGALGRGIAWRRTEVPLALRTRAQVVGDLSLSFLALLSLATVSWLSEQYVATLASAARGDRPSAELLAVLSGVLVTGFGLSGGYVAAQAWRGRRRLLKLLTIVLFLGSAAELTGIALTARPLGPGTPLNASFGLLHAGSLTLLGAVAESALVGSLHLLQLTSLSLQRWLVRAVATVLWLLQAVTASLEWLIRLISVFGQLVVRPRPPVVVGVAEVSRTAYAAALRGKGA
jgi:hypothetical protein